ncbi:17204_t:CDS:2, partial [Acaulospora colombiana]
MGENERSKSLFWTRPFASIFRPAKHPHYFARMATLLSLIPKPVSLTSPTALVLPSSPQSATSKQQPQHEQEEYSYADLRALVFSFRKLLIEELGVKHGDVVALSMTNTLEFVVSFIGTTIARAVSAPLNPAYSIGEFQFYLQDTKPALLLIPLLQGGSNKAAQTALEAGKKENIPVFEIWTGDPQPEDIALVLHTSGTTGRPKSVPLAHRNLMRTTANIIQTYDLNSSDRTYLVMPLFHVHQVMLVNMK